MNSDQTFYFQELSEITGIKPYVIRFWETEFSEIQPTVNNGEKIYSSQDVEILLKIKKFIFEDKLTITQAKNYLLKQNQDEEKTFTHHQQMNSKSQIIHEILAEIQTFKLKYQW